MKKCRDDEQSSKRNTVTFRPSRISILRSQSLEEPDSFTGRTKRNPYPSFVRFKKLQICSEQSQSQKDSQSKQHNQDKDIAPCGKIFFQRRNSKKNRTQYIAHQQQICNRSLQKKKTMIPIKVRNSNINIDKELQLTKRSTKSFCKMDSNKQIQNMSLKSIHSKYTKLKRQVSSLWNITTNNFIAPKQIKNPIKILQKENIQILQVQKQLRTIIHILEQEQSKKLLFIELNYTIKKIFQYQNNSKQVNRNTSPSNQEHTLFTQIPQNDKHNSSEFQSDKLHLKNYEIKIQEKTLLNHKQLNHINKNQNFLKSKLQKIKQQILHIRKQRAIFSGLYEKIQKQIKQQQKNYLQILVEIRNRLRLTIDIQIGSNLQRLKTIILKQYYQKNTFQSIKQQQITQNNNLLSQKGVLLQLKKQQSALQDSINLYKNYNSFSCLNVSFKGDSDRKLKAFQQSNNKSLIKPRKQLSSHHSEKRTVEEIQMGQLQTINSIQRFIQKIGINLGIKAQINSNQQYVRQIKNKQKFIKLNSTFNSQQINNFGNKSQFSQYQNDETQNITEQIIYKFNSLEKFNESFSKKIKDTDKEIFQLQQKIIQRKKQNIKKLNQMMYQAQRQEQNDKFQQQIENDYLVYQQIEKLFGKFSIKVNLNSINTNRYCKEKDISGQILILIKTLQQNYEQTVLNSTVKANSQANSVLKIQKKILQIVNGKQNMNKHGSSEVSIGEQSCIFNKFRIAEQDYLKRINSEVNKQKKQKKQVKQIQQSEISQQNIKNTNEQVCPLVQTLDKQRFFQNSQLLQVQTNELTRNNVNQPKQHISRHSRGLNTLISNMGIFQSYQKAMNRIDFQNQYKRQIAQGKKKKKTLLKRGLGLGAIN